MTSPSTEALLFDLGGVVFGIDFEKAFSCWAGDAGIAVQTIKSRYRIDEWYEKHERGEIAAAEYFDSLRQSLDIRISDEQFAAGWNAIFEDETAGIFELFRLLSARVPIYAFSNSNAMHQNLWEGKYACTLEYFRTVFVSCEIGLRKPEAAAYQHVAAKIDVEPERIVFFDDTRENIDGALDAGMSAVHVCSIDDIRTNVAEFLE
jgi:putative hydrolase of the HAD superfamily